MDVVISVTGPLWWRGRLVLRSVDFTILNSLMSGDEYTVCDVSHFKIDIPRSLWTAIEWTV